MELEWLYLYPSLKEKQKEIKQEIEKCKHEDVLEKLWEEYFRISRITRCVEVFLGMLDEKEKILVEKRFFERKSIDEIAKEMFISRSTYYVILNDIKKILTKVNMTLYNEEKMKQEVRE